ncbi:recombinase family protein [Streptomyces cinnamoneus]|uniref:recombinase family protein n=1 Tax=Streptomyces cinnamoneus TaxID=53446 RepID=UPI0033F52D98
MPVRTAGFTLSGDLVPEEVAYLREATSRLLAGERRADVTRWVNAEGHRTTAGNPWREEVLWRTLLRPRLAGLDADGQPIDGAPIVITPEEQEQLKALSPGRTDPVENREYPLGGAAVCGKCDWELIPSWAAGKPIYRCPSESQADSLDLPTAGEDAARSGPCGSISMNAVMLEDAVAELALAELLRPGAQERLESLLADVKAEVGRLKKGIKQIESRVKRLDAMLRTSMPDEAREGLLSSQKATRKEGRDARTRLRFLEHIADASLPTGDVDELIAWWKKAPTASKRALILLEIAKVRVGPGRRGRNPDPHERIDVEWR